MSQILFYPRTLESLTDTSDLVIRAKVAAVDGLKISLEAVEVIKGTSSGPVLVSVENTAANRNVLKSLKIDRVSVWFLQRTQGGGFRVEDLDSRTYGLTFAQAGRRLIDFGLYPVYIEKTILEKIRAEAALKPMRNDGELTLPAPSWYGGGKDLTITFPLDERIGPLARTWIQPGPGREPWMRLMGVRVLSKFRSEENEALLKAVAIDPGKIESAYGSADFKGEAAKTLREWGVDAPVALPLDELMPGMVSTAPVRVEIDGVPVSFAGVSAPRIISGRAYARACTLSSALGVKMYTYLLKTGTGVTLEGRGFKLDLPTDSHTVWVNGQGVETPLPSRLIKGEGFFPIRTIVEMLGGTIKWDAVRRTVVIKMAAL